MNSKVAKKNANGEGSIYQRKDGRWEGSAFVLTSDDTYKRRRVYGKSWDDAHEKSKPKVRRVTWVNYESLNRNYIVPGLGKKKVTRITARDIRMFLVKVARTCQCCHLEKDKKRPETKRRCCAVGQCCEKYPSDRTVRFLLVLVRSALEHAVREDNLPRNVARNVELSTGTQREIEPLSVEEGRKLLAAARGDRLWAVYELAVRLGLRRGEVLGLRWKDIDMHEGVIHVRQSLQRVKGQLALTATKTRRSTRRVALPDECVTALKARRAEQRADRMGAGPKWTPTDLVFTTRNGTPVEPRNLNRAFEALSRRAGIRQVRFHDLRHTCASLLHEQGADARTIMEVLGHSSIRVTMDIYTFVRLDTQRAAFDRVGQVLSAVDGNEPGDDEDPIGAHATL